MTVVADRVNLRVKSGKMKVGSGKMGRKFNRYVNRYFTLSLEVCHLVS